MDFILKTPGSRLRAVRAYCSASRSAFCALTGLSESTLKAWENDVAKLTRKGAAMLSFLFQKKIGIYCTEEWLLRGDGLSPMRLIRTEETDEVNEEAAIEEDCDRLRRTYNDQIVFFRKWRQGRGAPLFREGDIVGAIPLVEYNEPTEGEEVFLVDTYDGGVGAEEGPWVGLLRHAGATGFYHVLSPYPVANDEESAYLAKNARLRQAYRVVWHRRPLRKSGENYPSEAVSLAKRDNFLR